MKLTVRQHSNSRGFALPTILLVSTAMLAILMAAIGATAASRVALDSQHYNQLAQQAAESGIARAKECLSNSGWTPQWSTIAASRDLRPHTNCSGNATFSDQYVVGNAVGSTIRTKYSIEAPSGSGIGASLKVVGTTELVRAISPYTVWRSYEQVAYYKIEPPQKIACPAGFIGVPGNSLFGTDDFCVSKYEAKNVGGSAASQAAGLPYTNISQIDAEIAAAQSCEDCRLIDESEWLTIAHNVTNIGSNWTGGSVGSGTLFVGHSDNGPANSLEASSDDTNGYFGTGQSSGNQRRTMTLSNGEVIWDFAGNVWEWTSGQVSGAGNQPGGDGYNWRDWNDVEGTGTLSPNPFPSYGTPAASAWDTGQGIGGLWSNSTDASARAFARGGDWDGYSVSGVFGLWLDFPPDHQTWASHYVGFRIVLRPNSEITCSTGFVPVPGNSSFGTDDFCVAKYEAKSANSTAVSRPDGFPWINITQNDAASAAASSCSGCHLITEAEWLTIAHNVTNVASNWTGGSVGSGSLYVGHTDNSPASAREASPNDSNGYFGTGQSSGVQRRTLTLSNGEVIWDFSGNVWDWTAGQTAGGQPGGPGLADRQWNAIGGTGSLSPSPFPSFGTPAASGWTSTHGIGRIYSNSTETGLRGFLRGGAWDDIGLAGPFGMMIDRSPSDARANIGFRVAR